MNESVSKDAVTNRFFHRRDGVAECGSVGCLGGGDVGTGGMGMVSSSSNLPTAAVIVIRLSADAAEFR